MTTDNISISFMGSQQPSLSRLQSVKSDNVIRVSFEKRQNVAEDNNIPNKLLSSSDSSESSADSLNESVNELNNSDQFISRNLEFHIDNDSGRTVITVRDKETNDVIRQIPSEQLLEISSKLSDLQSTNQATNQKFSGILFTNKT